LSFAYGSKNGADESFDLGAVERSVADLFDLAIGANRSLDSMDEQ
jgi:hypothetical protein